MILVSYRLPQLAGRLALSACSTFMCDTRGGYRVNQERICRQLTHQKRQSALTGEAFTVLEEAAPRMTVTDIQGSLEC